jgi:hypothetical protein
VSRLALAAIAVLLATLLVPLGITSTWLSLRVDSTDAYVDTVAPLADDEELRDRLADEVATAAVSALQNNVPIGLPASLETAVRMSTEEVVESPGFPEFWRQANAKLHREFLAIVHEQDQQVDTDGWVVVDLQPLLDQVLTDFAAEFGIPARFVPSTPLLVPVLPESKLEEARGSYQLLDALALWVPLFWAGLVALAVLVAPGWRGRLRAGAACAVGVAIGGGSVLLLTGTATDVVVDQADRDNQDLARLVIEVVVSTLDDAAGTAVVGGVVVAALLVGGSLWPRRRAHPVHP